MGGRTAFSAFRLVAVCRAAAVAVEVYKAFAEETEAEDIYVASAVVESQCNLEQASATGFPFSDPALLDWTVP